MLRTLLLRLRHKLKRLVYVAVSRPSQRPHQERQVREGVRRSLDRARGPTETGDVLLEAPHAQYVPAAQEVAERGIAFDAELVGLLLQADPANARRLLGNDELDDASRRALVGWAVEQLEGWPAEDAAMPRRTVTAALRLAALLEEGTVRAAGEEALIADARDRIQRAPDRIVPPVLKGRLGV